MAYPTYQTSAPTSSLMVTDYLTPDAARIFVDACKSLKKLGLNPVVNLQVSSDPSAVPTATAPQGA